MDAVANRNFLTRVIDEPGPTGAGFINLHTHMKNTEPHKNGGKDWVIGWPFKTVDDLISRAQWVTGGTTFFDCWYCTSRQSEDGKSAKGKPKAVRLAKNAMSLKAIWVDVDVGNKPGETKHYATPEEAMAALVQFGDKVGMPLPSAVVNSGGGLHIYWISDKPLSPAEWAPYAQGLKALLLREGVKCDAGLTTDEARILRVPGTMNHKYDPPKPVVLNHLGQDYNFGTDLLFLTNFTVAPTATPGAAQHAAPNVMEPGDWSAPDPAFAALDAKQGGLGERTQGAHLVPWQPIFEQCAFFGDALLNGGKDYDNPLWNLSVLGTVFMEDGNELAQRISKGHRGWSEDATQALYDRKLVDRRDGGVGYPSCATIAGSGCKSCATCPLFAKGKSPLNIRAPLTAAVSSLPQSTAAQALNLPDNYDLDGKGFICHLEEKVNKAGETFAVWTPLFWCKITDAWVQKEPEMLHLLVTTDKGNSEWTAIAPWDFIGSGGDKALVKAKIMIRPEAGTKVGVFLMAFLAKMKEAQQSQAAVGFGWYRPQAAIEGFAFGSRIYKPDGSNMPAGLLDTQIQKWYTPTGGEQAWFDAWQFIKMQHRPDLAATIVASFAAPLMAMSGQNGAVLAVMGEPASGKTYAMEIACAVWGHPVKTRESENSTDKSVENRLGSTQNLPAFWDEVTEEAVKAKAFKLTNITTAGAVGGRATQSGGLRERTGWSTLVIFNGNHSFKEYVVKRQRSHGAALNRVFEVWVPRLVPNPVGQISNTAIPDRAKQALQHNFGMVGIAYSKYLAANHEVIQAEMIKNADWLSAKLQNSKEDRMWLAVCTAMLTGAQIANQLPTPVGFDIPALIDFLCETWRKNQEQRANAHVDAGAADYGEDYLTQYLKDRATQTMWTMTSMKERGNPGNVEFYITQSNVALHHSIQVRCDQVDNQLRFSKKNFEAWCALDETRVASTITASLEKTYGMTTDRRVLAAGTPHKVGKEYVYTIDVTKHPDLEAFVQRTGSFADENQALGVSSAPTEDKPSPAPGGSIIHTGITADIVKKLATDIDLAKKVAI